ncbi:inhibitor of nuclear factor kappa-B kinase subunit beta [Chelonus insularis]|uniref:inhibitor of nuclear factor kappa-B kinase subunit beta n=1 Tax=Chelonus insularis TaxID=460826 RepID=UPI00158DD3E0|nr:inhibitor of nuclear factor kappa-B kinase subunit beta [Chelonus insularis]
MSITGDNEDSAWFRVRVLGFGAFGVVEHWKNEFTKENIAIKKSHTRLDKSKDKKWLRWVQEVQIMNELNHLNIVGTRNIPEELKNIGDGLPILCMEYCTKGDLRSVLSDCDNICGVKSDDALRIMYDISSAVEYLHSKEITHRDLKPENIVIQEVQNKLVYKLIDLGYAKSLGEQSISASVVGTLNYLAPELLWKNTYSCSVDYWSLGILFYEILTGFRPFLPNMQLTQIWMAHVKNKKYEDISAKEMNDKIVFNTDFEEPHSVPKCIQADLVKWFRCVFQWNPKNRGKLPNQFNEIVVFSMLKSILNKKIITALIVPKYKYQYFAIESNFTLIQFQQLIYDTEGIAPEKQILTDSKGNILKDNFFSTIKSSKFILVFNSNQVYMEDIPKPVLLSPILEMIHKSREKLDYLQLKKYYGATISFMKRELELYRSYIFALSIMIDLCDAKFKLLQEDINNLSLNMKLLNDKVESICRFKNINDKKILDSSTSNLEELKNNVMKLVEGTKTVKEKLNSLTEKNNKLKSFSDIDWMSDLTENYETALTIIKTWQTEDRNQQQSPLKMVTTIFKFTESLHRRLTNPQLTENGRSIKQFLKQITTLKEVLKSFTALLNDYSNEVTTFKQLIENEMTVSQIDFIKNSNNLDLLNLTQDTSESTDTLIYNSILIRNMLGGLLVELDMQKRKYTDLNYFNKHQ